MLVECKNGEIKRSWFPKVTISILPPVKLPVDQALKGKARRNAAATRRLSASGPDGKAETSIIGRVCRAVRVTPGTGFAMVAMCLFSTGNEV